MSVDNPLDVDASQLGPVGEGGARDYLFGYQRERRAVLVLLGIVSVGLLAARIFGMI